MATASPSDAALRDVLERLHAASIELESAHDATEVAQRSADLVLALTRSSRAVIALGGLSHEFERYDRFFARSADDAPPPADEEVAEMLSTAGLLRRTGSASRNRTRGAAIGALLRAHGQVIGGIAVGRPAEYSPNEQVALDVFAAQVAMALAASSRWDEMWQSIERVESAHELAVQVLIAVSSHAVKGRTLSDFYRRLARTVGELVGAGRVLLWRLDRSGMLSPIDGGYRIDADFLSRLKPTPCTPDGDELASRVVFNDYVFRASTADDPPEHGYVLEALGVASAISVAWRAGEERLGLLSAYDSTRPGGFSREDTWVLEKAGLMAGVVTRLWESQEDVRRTDERLIKIDSARQILLRNLNTVVEKERKRFVAELHDDALQKLTAAELQLARIGGGRGGDTEVVAAVRELLEQTEAALRRLVFDVRPPALDNPDGLAQSVKDRMAGLEAAGIKATVELDLPEDMSLDLKAMLFRQVAEALGNVERHSEATEVKVSLRHVDGGVRGLIVDNGRGFVVAERSNLPGHLGLLALRERALMAGGRYNIESRLGAGTTVEFWIPLGQ